MPAGSLIDKRSVGADSYQLGCEENRKFENLAC